MYQVSNFTENDDVKVLSELGAFQIIEYQRDLSVSPSSAVTAYFSAQMNVKKRQLVCHLHKSHVTIQAGAMQWMLGNVNATTGIKGVGDFLGGRRCAARPVVSLQLSRSTPATDCWCWSQPISTLF